jgi:hypothetical protein
MVVTWQQLSTFHDPLISCTRLGLDVLHNTHDVTVVGLKQRLAVQHG